MRQPQIKRSPSKTKKYTYPLYIKCTFSLALIHFYKEIKGRKLILINIRNQIMQNVIPMHDSRFVYSTIF